MALESSSTTGETVFLGTGSADLRDAGGKKGPIGLLYSLLVTVKIRKKGLPEVVTVMPEEGSGQVQSFEDYFLHGPRITSV